jgi:hypothetical protein
MPILKPPIHVQQITSGYCLPACSQMALAQLDIKTTQPQLAHILGTRVGIGTPFSRVERLRQWQIQVEITEWAGIERLAASMPEAAVIVAVTTTSGLPGWNDIRTQHTLLVLSITTDQVTYHDPAFPQGPVSAPRGEFLLAWSEMAELTAFLSRR